MMTDMRELLVATGNAGKLREFEAFFEGAGFSLKKMRDVIADPAFQIEEVGETFEGNALIKAFLCGKKSGLLSIADDSGVEIDALNGEPGVRSARYVEGSDADRNNAVLEKMKDVPDNMRTARFVSVIAMYDPVKDIVRVTLGECEGSILREPRGTDGFGYDPLFLVTEIGKTYAETSIEEKHRIDHRGKALRAMKELLPDFV